MVRDKKERKCGSEYCECPWCGKCFSNSKGYTAHTESCSRKNKSKINKQSSMDVTTNSSTSFRQLKHQETDNRYEDLMSNLSGGWSKKRRRSTRRTSQKIGTSPLSMVSGNRIVLQIGGGVNERTEPVVKKELREPSSLGKKFKVRAMKEKEGLDHPVDHENREVRRPKKTEPPVFKKEFQASSNFDKVKVSAVKEKDGLHHPEKHKCEQCGQVFHDFKRLERHMLDHSSRKKGMEEEGDHEESEGNKNRKEAQQCPHCKKSFPSRKAHGCHIRFHNKAHPIKTFDKVKVSAVKEKDGLHHPEKHKCEQCGQVLHDFRRLERHMLDHSSRKKGMEEEGDHEESEANKNRKEAQQCPHCEKSFPSREALGGHIWIHSKDRSIKTFDWNQVRRPKKTDTPVVKKELQESSNFDKVKVSAVKEKDGLHHLEEHKCEQCGQVFHDFRRLERHMLGDSCRKKGMEEEGDHEESEASKKRKEAQHCPHCEKSFPSRKVLGDHIRIHNKAHSTKTFDLNQLPPEDKFFGV